LSEQWETLIQDLVRSGILKTPQVTKALRTVPRRLFLPEDNRAYAAVDSPLPIGLGQTVSAPLG